MPTSHCPFLATGDTWKCHPSGGHIVAPDRSVFHDWGRNEEGEWVGNKLPLPGVSWGSWVMTHVRVALSGKSHFFLQASTAGLWKWHYSHEARGQPGHRRIIHSTALFTCVLLYLRYACPAGLSTSGEHFFLAFALVSLLSTAQARRCQYDEWTDVGMSRLGKSQVNCIFLHSPPSGQSNKHSFILSCTPRTSSSVRLLN